MNAPSPGERTGLPGVEVWPAVVHDDDRGRFVKTLHPSWAGGEGIDLREEFYSVSSSGVLRGMHFQVPPADHTKWVTCVAGRVLDVLLDLRPGDTYGRAWSIELDADRPATIAIPRGVAHGFLSLTEGSVMLYRTDHEHSPNHDRGIAWNSFGFDWPLDAFGSDLRTSPRDAAHPTFSEFDTPF